jgi:hypothetical protein
MGLAREAAASSLAYEGFQYLPGQPLPTMATGTGWGAGWTGSLQMVDQPPSLSYPWALPPMGDALLNPAPGEAFRPFIAPFNNSASDLWISFEEESLGAGSGSFVDLQLTGSAISDIAVNKDALGALTLNGAAAGLSAGPGNVDLFVLQLAQFGGGVTMVNLFVDPGPVLGAPSASFTVSSILHLNQFYFRTDPNQLLDEIRVGTTLQDVAATAVPEPSAFALLAFALLPFAARKGQIPGR